MRRAMKRCCTLSRVGPMGPIPTPVSSSTRPATSSGLHTMAAHTVRAWSSRWMRPATLRCSTASRVGPKGSILGFDSAQGDGFFRWRNETFGWKETVSNMLRNLSEQLGARGATWNEGVYHFVLQAHQRLGIDVNDPGTTWPGSSFGPPQNANHEANAPNRWHLAIMLAIWCVLILRLLRRRERHRPLYALALFCAFAALCAYLKWQPFMARLLLPLFVLSAPLAGVIGGIGGHTGGPVRRWLAPLVQLLICLFLLSNARLPLLENWVRPLKGPRSVLHTPRSAHYFADMNQWNNQASYWKAVDLLAGSLPSSTKPGYSIDS